LRRSRRGIEQPLVYEIVDGRLLEAETRVEIDSNAIRKEMQRHFSCGPSMPLSDEEINLFIAIFGDVIQSLDAEALSTGEYSDSDDQTNYCELPLSVIDELIEKCGGFYSPSQLAALRQFAEGHRGASDVMALIKRSAIVFSPNA
ncbi:MAG TPA: hypothetical protein VF452_14920, partial [Candidatus Binatia bacterium]